jgi:hypothetical protein
VRQEAGKAPQRDLVARNDGVRPLVLARHANHHATEGGGHVAHDIQHLARGRVAVLPQREQEAHEHVEFRLVRRETRAAQDRLRDARLVRSKHQALTRAIPATIRDPVRVVRAHLQRKNGTAVLHAQLANALDHVEARPVLRLGRDVESSDKPSSEEE